MKEVVTVRPGLLPILAGTSLSSLAFGSAFPIMPLHARSLGATVALSGLIMAALSMARVFINIPAGAYGEKHGYRRLIIGGSLLRVAVALVYAMTKDLTVLMVLSFAMGLGTGIKWTALLSSAGKLSTPETRGSTMSRISTADVLGYCPGPMIGGLLADRFGLSAPFLSLAFFDLLSVVAVLVLLKEDPSTGGAPEHHEEVPTGDVHLFKTPAFWFVAMAQFVMQYAVGGSNVTSPLVATLRCSMTAAQFGTSQTIGLFLMVLLIPVGGRLFDRGYRRQMLFCGAVLILLGNIWYTTAASFWPYMAASLLVFAGAAFLYPAPQALTADMARSNEIGRAMGTIQTVGDAGGLVGPMAQGAIVDAVGGTFTIPLLSAALAQFAAFSFLALRTKAKTRPQLS